MEDQNNTHVTEPTEPTIQAPVTPVRSQQPLTAFARVERVTAWVLIISAILFALIGIASIWGAFGDNTDVVWRSLGSLSVIALAALVINVGARMAEGKK